MSDLPKPYSRRELVGGTSDDYNTVDSGNVSTETHTAETGGTHEADETPGPGEYVLDAELTFSDPDLVLVPTLTNCKDLSFHVDFWTGPTESPETLYVSMGGPIASELDAVLSEDPTVEIATCIATFDSSAVYRITPASDATRLLPAISAVDGYVRDIDGSVAGWTVRMHLPDRDALSALNDSCRETGISMSVSYLGNLQSGDAPHEQTLSVEQRELLLVACREGYFSVPRNISQRDLAETFGVSPSAISQRLRTAICTLVASSLDAG